MNRTGKNVLITGAVGYVGSVLVRKLIERGYFVRAVDSLMYGGNALEKYPENSNLEFIKLDIRNTGRLKDIVKDMDSVIHLAAIVGDPACQKNPQLSKEVNLESSINLFEAAKRDNVKRFIFSSTCSNYGRMAGMDEYVDERSPLRPVSLYAELKVNFEMYILNSPKTCLVPTCLRFATAYGLSPRMRFDLTVNEFSRDLFLSNKLTVYGEQFWRPYCHVEDITSACIKALEADDKLVSYEVFNVGDTGENYQKKTIAELIVKYIPGSILQYVRKDEDPRDYKVDFSKIGKVLNFKIKRHLEDGILEIIDTLRAKTYSDPYDAAYRNS